MTYTIALASQKGGVGKTTSTINIGAAFAETGARVLLIDLDPQGALTTGMGVDHATLKKTVYDALIEEVPAAAALLHVKPYVDLLPATIDLAGAEAELMSETAREKILSRILEPFRDRYDFVLIDCPPSLGLLTINALSAADGVLIPVQTQFLSYRGMQLLLRQVQKVQKRVSPHLVIAGLLPTLYDARASHDKEIMAELRANYPQWLIDEPIKRRTSVADAMVSGQSILEFAGHSDVADSYRKVAEVLAHGAQAHPD